MIRLENLCKSYSGKPVLQGLTLKLAEGARLVALGPSGCGKTTLLRLVAGLVVGAGVLKDPHVVADFWLIPLRDLFGFAVWMGGLFGRHVYWRDRELRLHHDGRINAEERKPEPIYHH